MYLIATLVVMAIILCVLLRHHKSSFASQPAEHAKHVQQAKKAKHFSYDDAHGVAQGSEKAWNAAMQAKYLPEETPETGEYYRQGGTIYGHGYPYAEKQGFPYGYPYVYSATYPVPLYFDACPLA